MLSNNKALVGRYVDEVLNKGNTMLLEELIAPTFIGHEPPGPDVHGPEGVKQRYAVYRTAFPDLQYTVEEVIAENDTVVWRWTAHATHIGEIMGIAPTRKQVTIIGAMTCQIVNGKFEEAWVNWDALGLLQQLGALPRRV